MSESKIKIWPTVTAAGEKMQVHNTGTTVTTVSGITWWSTHGQSLEISVDMEMGAGSGASIAVPEILAPGIYFLRLSLPDGASVWTKVLLSE